MFFCFFLFFFGGGGGGVGEEASHPHLDENLTLRL